MGSPVTSRTFSAEGSIGYHQALNASCLAPCFLTTHLSPWCVCLWLNLVQYETIITSPFLYLSVSLSWLPVPAPTIPASPWTPEFQFKTLKRYISTLSEVVDMGRLITAGTRGGGSFSSVNNNGPLTGRKHALPKIA